mgnify:CR=1 FL=1
MAKKVETAEEREKRILEIADVIIVNISTLICIVLIKAKPK